MKTVRLLWLSLSLLVVFASAGYSQQDPVLKDWSPLTTRLEWQSSSLGQTVAVWNTGEGLVYGSLDSGKGKAENPAPQSEYSMSFFVLQDLLPGALAEAITPVEAGGPHYRLRLLPERGQALSLEFGKPSGREQQRLVSLLDETFSRWLVEDAR